MSAVPVTAADDDLLRRFHEVAGPDAMVALERLASRLRSRRLVMVNSTATGGGVAEILRRLVTLLQTLGVETRWQIMPGDDAFFRITKNIHNALHGAAAEITPADWDHFDAVTEHAARTLDLDGDLVLIHDPQPIGLIRHLRRPRQRWVWRCHIDLSVASRTVLDRLALDLPQYDAAIFSHHEFVPALDIPAFLVPPSIDPFSDKNRMLEPDEVRAHLEPLALPRRVPLITQVSRFDRLKDPLGVLDAFTLVRRQEEAHLVLAGGTADDDPEGREVLAEVRERAGSREDVSILDLPPDAHLAINALQRASTLVVQKSVREGFGLTVSEALWKQRAVVAGAVGGIPLQVLHDRTGMLVRSIPGCALQMTRLLRSADLRRRLGRNGREHVRHNFLLPREARDYLAVFAWLETMNGGRAPVS
ncbi:MAG: glycosyltransferase [Candidatus Eisenbacteria bacterium]